ncbi:hypothetical protein PV327_011112 [Microctonus hyperodae]|uniref:Uncharacterized protein n=1 Tax=Microctonus hyperodae TaxID=165561 RepID=A0AA39F061_MICHY|nr:hypothetical protein PV327_011112 [Microctonus hyperodae]
MKLAYVHIVVLGCMLQILIVSSHGLSNDTNNFERFKRSPPLEKLTLLVKINGRSEIINLIATNQILANEHLPVWISSNKPDNIYHKLDNVMQKDVGEFTLYHDYYTRSAIVYFHKREELDGIININYKIQGLSIKDLDLEHVICQSDDSIVRKIMNAFQRKQPPCHCSIGCSNNKQKIYPELLVAISHDMFEAIENTSIFSRGVKTISHVLIVYNIVDMMYKYVKTVDISLNIAGIVIEGTEDQWGFTEKSNSYINIDRINDNIEEYFQAREAFFPRHSFDYVVYNTRLYFNEKWSSSQKKHFEAPNL